MAPIKQQEAGDGATMRTMEVADVALRFKRKRFSHHKDGRDWMITGAQNKKPKEKFPGRRPVDPEKVKKFDYGPKMDGKPYISNSGRGKRAKILRREAMLEANKLESVRAEMLLTEKPGCLEATDGFSTAMLTQRNILEAADITTQCKSFDLKLHEFGPYKFQYYREGRDLAMAGRAGHLATFDWVTKKLNMEVNVMESLHDVTWLQDRRTIAVAQKKWLSVYDDKGTEIHCVRRFDNLIKVDYLPYHFLLAGLGQTGLLHFLDVSLGKEVTTIKTKRAGPVTMAHNPYNGVVSTAHVGGVVCMWTPSAPDPVATVLCHKDPIVAMVYDPAGRHMTTLSRSRELRIWDARNVGDSVYATRLPRPCRNIAVSQTGLLAVGYDTYVEVYRGMKESSLSSYMTHRTESPVHQLQFCPFEDVLGISTVREFCSIVVPGAGEANFDAAEVNPYSSAAGCREGAIKGLLAKIPSELITLDPMSIIQVDVPTLKEKLEAQRKLKYVTVPHINPTPRYRMKGKSSSVGTAKRKMIKKDIHKTRYLDTMKHAQREAGLDGSEDKPKQKDRHKEKILDNFMDRFKK